jgi:hypothetical protein
VHELTDAVAEKITALVKKAAEDWMRQVG